MQNDGDTAYRKTRRGKLKRALTADNYSGAANALFGDMADKYGKYFQEVRMNLEKANINMLFRTYVAQIFLTSVLTAFTFFLILLVMLPILGVNMLLSAVLLITVPSIMGMMALVFLYMYPSRQADQRGDNIDQNLPFALNQMSAVASSGIPPSSMFKLLTNFQEYEEIANEAEKIITKIEIFGEDLTTALREVGQTTPSDRFQEVIYGMISTIETGGNLNDFLEEQAESALFDYRMRRQKQIENLSAFASFYTAILVAAPLFLIAIMAVINMIGGNLAGFAIEDIINLGIYIIIPAINTAFVLMLHIKYQGI
ncbi:MAG: type II secretion system F family protein [Candidatus Nanohaloarchaeota archaeon QJJ-5]|nr:type II secretion system F family protein [Candidatus Nanohaloarchaeota archaeon QJJ-5]